MKNRKSIILCSIVIASLFFQGLVGLNSEANSGRGWDERDHANSPKDPKDPCEQLIDVRGNANGLHKRCDAIGAGSGAARGDFNGDGIADLAVGVPFEDQDGVNAVGGVNIIYGSTNGLTATGDQFFDMTDFGFFYQSNAHFGWALAAGNFNGDNYSDLAISAPDVDSGVVDKGAVFVLDGSATGLDISTGEALSTILSSGTRADNRDGGRMGAALIWANFDGDEYDDLAIGYPNAPVSGDCRAIFSSVNNAGSVEVLYGTAQGLRTIGEQILRQGNCFDENGIEDGVGDSPEEGDGFGASLAVVNGDLVIGVPFEDLALFDKQDAGLIHLLNGTSSGIDISPRQILTQDTPGVGGGAETGDQFGRVLHGGKFGKATNLHALAVGIPFEDVLDNTADDGGAVQVFFASSGTDVVLTTGSLFIGQSNLPGVAGEDGDLFGWSLASGDFDGDGRPDLAVGSPGEDFGGLNAAGIVNVLYGSEFGPSTTRVQLWHQDISGIQDAAEPNDQFGFALSAWNFGRDSRADLAIGAPFEDLISAVTGTLLQDAGAVHIIYGGSGGLSSAGTQFWHQDVTGINDTAQVGDHFGRVLY